MMVPGILDQSPNRIITGWAPKAPAPRYFNRICTNELTLESVGTGAAPHSAAAATVEGHMIRIRARGLFPASAGFLQLRQEWLIISLTTQRPLRSAKHKSANRDSAECLLEIGKWPPRHERTPAQTRGSPPALARTRPLAHSPPRAVRTRRPYCRSSKAQPVPADPGGTSRSQTPRPSRWFGAGPPGRNPQTRPH